MKQQLSPEKYITGKGRLLPIHECFISEDWGKSGLATVVISRKMPSEKIIMGLYLVDVLCLGLKDTSYKFAMSAIEFSEFLNNLNQNQAMVKCEPNFAHNLIFGAIDFASESGFSPNKGFKITEYLLNTDLIDDGIDTIEFGRNGKPLFVAGPFDDVNRIIGILERNLGTGNYDYIMP
ncbi:MAG: hypothetical protein HC906_20090 [Bacteroidales bacterium]|nr:hypothetical protein [Bacteroidales bacterium]